MLIPNGLLEKTCKDMIETILLCLEHAHKGTIYRIGPIPKLRAVRITSGIRKKGNGEIRWGLPEVSDYNPPGKSWEQYRDRPGRAMEAMGWCVERQKSWTSDNPYEDIRSVRKQLHGQIEDYHHMEPVLVRKKDIYGDQLNEIEFPLDWQGNPIWEDTDYLTVGVVKIHFLPRTVRRGDRSTKIIKKLSRTLGTELLSLHLRETLAEAHEDLSRQRLESCNALAHELRNTLVKLSFIFSAINAEISFLREQWESEMKRTFPALEDKTTILSRLNELIRMKLIQVNGEEELTQLGKELIADQEELATLFLLPQEGEQWVKNKIQRKWHRLLAESEVWNANEEEIKELLKKLQKAIWIGMDEILAQKMTHLPEDLRTRWLELAYLRFSPDKLSMLGDILKFLEHPALKIPHKQQTKRVLNSLKALAEIIPEMEERANKVIFSLKHGMPSDEVQDRDPS
jgi:hypothetical protein